MDSTTARSPFRDFLELSYEELEVRNAESKESRQLRVADGEIEEQRRRYLTDEKRIKAVTVCFTDLEGRLHMLDYDKKYLLDCAANLAFDGSRIRGFDAETDIDLRLRIDWSAFYWLPGDVFGSGKVIVFGDVLEKSGQACATDFRGRLRELSAELYRTDKTVAKISPEIEGFLFQGRDAERRYYDAGAFEFISTGGYYHSLPQDPLRRFIDHAAEVQRAMAFGNEKDHPEVGPSQFEMNFSRAEATIAADQIQLYKLICRQVAHRQDMTASFLPQPVAGVNSSKMHINLSLARGDKNLFYAEGGRDGLSDLAHQFAGRLVNVADDICLILNSSVNAYRGLDPRFGAPNEIKASATNRAAMIRIPPVDASMARIEVQAVAPDANPYMLIHTLLRTGLEGPDLEVDRDKRPRTRMLPDNIYSALRQFKRSEFMARILGEDVHARFAALKQMVADRCPKALGDRIKRVEIMFHHEVTNQMLWNQF